MPDWFPVNFFGSNNEGTSNPKEEPEGKEDETLEKDDENYLDPFSPNEENERRQSRTPKDAGQRQSQQQQTQSNPSLEEYISGLDFGGVIDQSTLASAIETNDMKAVVGEFSKAFNNIYKNILVDANKMTQSMVQAANKEVLQQVSGDKGAEKAMGSLQERIPIAKDPRYEPVVRATLTGFLQKGETLDKALDKTVTYMQNLSGELSKQFSRNEPPNNPGDGRGGFSGISQDARPEPDWKAIIGGS